MNLIESQVLSGDFCIGCGACASAKPERYHIKFDDQGKLKAFVIKESLITKDLSDIDYICPFTSVGPNERVISDEIFPLLAEFENVGRFEECYLGYVTKDNFRELGSSGGFGKWIQSELIRLKLVDFVIQVAFSNNNNRMYDFKIYSNHEDVIDGARSAYYPISMDQILKYIEETPGRYSITAVPCFAKAIRLLSDKNPILKNRIKFIIGIICGHLKSKYFAEALSWQVGVHPNNLSKIEFRGKIPGKKANEKGVVATDKFGIETEPQSSKSLFGGNWGHNLFKYKACDYCDDVIAETADCAIGDAWLPEVVNDHAGNNVVVIRNSVLNNIIKEGIENKDLNFEIIHPKKVIESQLGGIRHRSEGLSLRLFDDINLGKWVPTKRINPSELKSKARSKLYRDRVKLRIISFKNFSKLKISGSFSDYKKSVMPFVNELERRPLWRIYISNIKSFIFTKVLKK